MESEAILKRIRAYAIRYFEQAGQVRWPTLREVARSVRISQADVVDVIESTDCDIDLTGFNFDIPTGAKFVEVYGYIPPEQKP